MKKFNYIFIAFWHAFEVLFLSAVFMFIVFFGGTALLSTYELLLNGILPYMLAILFIIFCTIFFFILRWSSKRIVKNGYSNVGREISIISSLFVFLIIYLITNFFFSLIKIRAGETIFDHFPIGALVGIIFSLPFLFITKKHTGAETNE
jgi:membrane protease YdiL (CAAX protease family)